MLNGSKKINRTGRERRGVIQGLISGISFALNGVIMGLAMARKPFIKFSDPYKAPLAGAAINDSLAGIWLLVYNGFKGKLSSLFKSLKTKAALIVFIAAFVGGPIGNGAYLLGIQFAGAAYALPISALTPVFAAILGKILLDQDIEKRVGIGIGLSVIGAIIIGYSPGGEQIKNFKLGLFFSLLAALAWGAEGAISALGMEDLDPEIAINIRQISSAIIFIVFVLPFLGALGIFKDLFNYPLSLFILIIGAFFSGLSFLTWYQSNDNIGVAKAGALNISYALWGVVFSWILGETKLSWNLLIGVSCLFFGSLLVSLDPRDLKKKEK